MTLRIDGISKTYPGGVCALESVNLRIGPGMFGLLGPNGAGKSTLMRIIATLQVPDAGSVRLGDLDIGRDRQAVRQVLGYLPQEFGVYPRMSAEGFLDHLALLKGITRRGERKELVESILRLTNLLPYRRDALGTFSGGMKQRFGIAQALLGRPRLLIVDEPTAGLDPEERNRFHNILSEIGEETIVLLSTHIVSDVSELCPNLAIIHRGRLLYTGRTRDALEEVDGRIWRRTIHRSELEGFRERYPVISTRLSAGRTNIHVVSAEPPGNGFEPVEPDLRDVYFCAINHRLPRAAG